MGHKSAPVLCLLFSISNSYSNPIEWIKSQMNSMATTSDWSWHIVRDRYAIINAVYWVENAWIAVRSNPAWYKCQLNTVPKLKQCKKRKNLFSVYYSCSVLILLSINSFFFLFLRCQISMGRFAYWKKNIASKFAYSDELWLCESIDRWTKINDFVADTLYVQVNTFES